MNNLKEKLIENLIHFEMSIAHLYITYGKIFPDTGNRWADLAEEECRHARLLVELPFYLERDDISAEDASRTILDTSHAIQFIDQQILRAVLGKTDLQEALNLALIIENTALESSLLKIFSFKGAEAEKIRRRLVSETRSHRERLTLWLDQVEKEADRPSCTTPHVVETGKGPARLNSRISPLLKTSSCSRVCSIAKA